MPDDTIDFKEEVAEQLGVLERSGLDMTHAHQANQIIRSLGGGRMVTSGDDIPLANYYIFLLFAKKSFSNTEVAA
jgi:hypothetical protein